jgi:DNA-binding NarL/FixJ family response regulator
VTDLSERIRILIVDDHLAVAEGLHALLSRQPDFELTDVATNGQAALRIAADRQPHVVLMDQNLSGESGVAVAASILGAGSKSSVVMFSGGMTQDELIAAVEVGVSGYLAKTTPVAEIVHAIRRAAAGEMLLPSTELAALLRRGRERASLLAQRRRATPQLTPREREVLTLMAQAQDAQRIAEKLGISVNTARGYVQQVLEKLDAHSRLEAVVRANELGLLAT